MTPFLMHFLLDVALQVKYRTGKNKIGDSAAILKQCVPNNRGSNFIRKPDPINAYPWTLTDDADSKEGN